MKEATARYVFQIMLLAGMLASMGKLQAQTDMDGIMMRKNNFCTGFQYSYSGWDTYWEGKLKRTNENLGTVSTQMIGWMGNFGISDKLNVMASLPYVKTKASAGTLHGVDGLQDISISVKYQAFETKGEAGVFKVIGVAGISLPVSNYVVDYQPLALGFKSKTATVRVILDYETHRFYATLAGAYVFRNNTKIDRPAYYTTELHLTNEVEMPDAGNFQAHLGYRGKIIGAELFAGRMITFGGFDITRNNMPFPSNRMNATVGGINIKCNPRALPGLSIMAGGSYVLDGRNVGQSKMYGGGLAYVFDFNKKAKKSK
jgi:hypothetical protein